MSPAKIREYEPTALKREMTENIAEPEEGGNKSARCSRESSTQRYWLKEQLEPVEREAIPNKELQGQTSNLLALSSNSWGVRYTFHFIYLAFFWLIGYSLTYHYINCSEWFHKMRSCPEKTVTDVFQLLYTLKYNCRRYAAIIIGWKNKQAS